MGSTHVVNHSFCVVQVQSVSTVDEVLRCVRNRVSEPFRSLQRDCAVLPAVPEGHRDVDLLVRCFCAQLAPVFRRASVEGRQALLAVNGRPQAPAGACISQNSPHELPSLLASQLGTRGQHPP
eukprot:scaffold48_cov311-Pinguiococcus_pyrenoidosus.AAC.174